MQEFFLDLIHAVLDAGKPGFIAIMLLLICGMGWFLFNREEANKKERRELVDQFQTTIEVNRRDLMKVINEFQDGQITMIEAINSIKVLIATVGKRL